jgi:hypothetical protein
MGTNNNSINSIEVDFVKFYLFLRDDVGVEMDIEDAKETYITLNAEGYCKVQDHYLYNNEEVMKELAKEDLDTKLEDADEVASMFSIDDIADMWIHNTSKDKVAEEYISENGWCDVLECEEPEDGYTDSNGSKLTSLTKTPGGREQRVNDLTRSRAKMGHLMRIN